MSRDLVFSQASKFSDLFDSAVPYDFKNQTKGRIEWTKRGDLKEFTERHTAGNVITSYCSVDDENYRSFHVRPKPEIIDYIRENMIDVDYDHIYFQVIVRDDQTALITASYNQIIGSRWLALIDASTVPQKE